MAKALIVAAVLSMMFGGSVTVEAAGPPVPISGTFFKGPVVGGVDLFVGDVLQVRGEEGFGSLTGGVLTGAAHYTIHEEIISFGGGIGTLHVTVEVTTGDGSVITLGLSGVTSGVSLTAPTVTVSGSWTIVSAVGPSAPLRGQGQFTGVEEFETGVTSGAFSGLIH